jgi:hypothetical protein
MDGAHHRGGISYYFSRHKAFNISNHSDAQVFAWFGHLWYVGLARSFAPISARPGTKRIAKDYRPPP